MRIATPQLAESCLRQDDCTRLFQFLNDERIPIRVVILKQYRAKGGGCTHGIDLIFEDDRYAVKRADGA